MKTLLACLLLSLPLVAWSSAPGTRLDAVNVDLDDQASLQRGARIFVNYCLSCHSAAYMRYNRMGQDLGISEELVKENLLFAADRVGDPMKAVMPKEDAKVWFGTAPPDLTLVSRARGPEWVYTYMRSFYRDPKSPSGWNNTVFPSVAMPHVLYEWQGEQRAVYKSRKNEAHKGKSAPRGDSKVLDKLVLEIPGSMSPADYNQAMRDLTNFLVYLGEPAKLDRYRIGVYVLIFLVIFFMLAYGLKKEYWKDIH